MLTTEKVINYIRNTRIDDSLEFGESVDDLAFVGHVRRVNGNARMVLGAVQIVLKISSNVSGEKLKPHLEGAVFEFLGCGRY